VKKLYDEMEEFKEIYEMVDFIALGE